MGAQPSRQEGIRHRLDRRVDQGAAWPKMAEPRPSRVSSPKRAGGTVRGTMIPPKETALLVVDVQESFRHRPYFRPDDLPSFFDRLQALADGAKAKGWAVVRVLHVEDEGVFSEASGHVSPMPEVRYQPDVTVKKTRHSALVGSTLPIWLVRHGVRRLVVSGIRTEQCCETTTRHAADSGYAVDYVTEATLTFPLRAPSGRELSVADLKERTEAALHERFATVTTVAKLLVR
jgi:nicotinamidase-related amidase